MGDWFATNWRHEAVDCPICGGPAYYNRARTVFCGPRPRRGDSTLFGCGAIVGRSGSYSLPNTYNQRLPIEKADWRTRRKPLPIYPVCDGSVVRE